MRADPCRRPVGRSVVDDDHLEVAEALGGDARERAGEKHTPIARRDDHGEPGRQLVSNVCRPFEPAPS